MVIASLTRNGALAVLTMLLLFAAATVSAANIEVDTDRDRVAMNESFRIVFRAEGSLSGDPDFSPLEKNFQILSTSQSSNFTLINGDMERSKTWTLTVLPRHSGNLTIPAVAFGDEQSPRASVMVTEAASKQEAAGEADIFLEVNAEPRDPYVQSQVIYNLKLYRAIPTSNASLEEPVVESGDAVIERIGEDKAYLTRAGGKRYRVVERDYAVYPQASGKLTIAPVEFRGRVARDSFSLLDPFGPRPEAVVRRSDAVSLEVRAVPDAFNGGHWLPSSNVSLEEKWSAEPPQFRVGEPITRTLILKAEGQTASQLPKLPDRVPEGFKHYPDQPVLNDEATASGITGSRREKTALIPQRPGDFTLPSVRIPWWNTNTDRMEYAEVPERAITVAAAPGSAPAQSKPAPLPQLEKPEPPAEPEPQTGQEPSAAKPERAEERGINPWLILSVALVAIWLVTLLAWWASSRRRAVAKQRGGDSLRRVRRDLKRACTEGDPRGARQHLQQWGRLVWPEDPPLNPVDLGRRVDPELEQAMQVLNDHLYGRNTDSWDGESFWGVFENTALKKKNGKRDDAGNLEPLHRL